MNEALPVYPNPATQTARKLKEAEIKEKIAKKENEEITLSELMKLKSVREIFNRWLELTKMDEPIDDPRSDKIHRRLGHRDIGLAIKKELETASPDLYDLMVREAREEKLKEGKNGGRK